MVSTIKQYCTRNVGVSFVISANFWKGRRSFFLVVVSFLHLSSLTAAWVTFNEAGFNWSCFLLQLVLGMLHVYLSLLSYFFSLFLQFTSFESSLLFTPYELEIESVSSALARLWSFTGVPVFRFQFVPIKLLELAAGFDLASFRKNVVHSSPRPRCLG